MNTIVKEALIKIPVDAIDVEWVKKELTVVNPTYYKALNMGVKNINAPSHYHEYIEEDGYIYVPRCYDYTTQLLDENISIVDSVPPFGMLMIPNPPKFKPGFDLLPQQVAPYDILKSGETGIICMGCGSGKSVLALKAAFEMSGSFMIVAHTVEILNQWKGYILKFFDGIDEDAIGWIQGSKFDWNKPVVLATLQTLALKNFPDNDETERFINHPNLIIYDEVHRLGAEQFRRAVSMFPAQRWGLSATPRRRDTMDILFRLHIGEVLHEDIDTPLTPKVYMMPTNAYLDLDKFKNRFTKKTDHARLDTALSKDVDRNDQILRVVKRLAKNDRKIMVVGNRVEHLAGLYRALESTQDVGLMVGAPKYKKERVEAVNKPVIFGAYKIVSEGLNIPELDTLIFVAHFSDHNLIQQILGRILRNAPNKKEPKVFYLWDEEIQPYKVMGYNFRRYCIKQGYDVVEL